MSEEVVSGTIEKPTIKTGMVFTNDAFLGGFSYRVITVLEGDEYDVHVEPWGQALDENDPGILRMSGEAIRNILGN